MKRRVGLVGALVTSFLVAAVVTSVVLAANGYEVFPDVIGGGGGRSESGGYVLDSTIGQAVVGIIGGSDYELCAGFWCAGSEYHSVYLPLAVRGL